MPLRLVAVVHHGFQYNKKHIERGHVFTSAEDLQFVLAHHPEKVTKSMHDVDDDVEVDDVTDEEAATVVVAMAS